MARTTERTLMLQVMSLVYVVWDFPLSLPFSIDKEHPVVFNGDATAQFGYRVVQTRSNGTSWMVVSAPLSDNRKGALFRCSYDTQQCQPVILPHIDRISLGLSLVTDEVSKSKIVACGPTWERRCGKLDYLNGICYVMNNFDPNVTEIHPAFQECTYGVDAAILYDDSGSIGDADFLTMQNFILDLMKLVAGMDVQFAVVQFSRHPNIVVDFALYNKTQSQVEDKIRNFPRTRGSTYTPTAIHYVATEVFTAQRGMRPHTKKFLIVLTDGISNDVTTSFDKAIEATVEKGITRYAIGVGKEFQRQAAKDELLKIASSKNNYFYVADFAGLHNLQDQLRQIFSIEGIPGATSFHKQLSQGGFSALLDSNFLVTGAVGVYDWGGALEGEFVAYPPQVSFTKKTLFRTQDKDSYLGYSVVVAQDHQRKLYLAGAPRYKHIGRVEFFEGSQPKGYIIGSQVGSYFGAELCSVDLDADGNTDLLLIGAPLYYNRTQGGVVEVFSFKKNRFIQTLRGEVGHSFGRFGAAICSLGDVSGDGLAEVAVGAPMEDDGRGAIYIFLGEKDRLRESNYQRISATFLSTKFHFFGQSMQGGLDLSGDNLADLAVGALGNALLLRSRPIFTVISSLTFSNPWIPLDDPKCMHGKIPGVAPRGNLSLCLTLKVISEKWSNAPAFQATISFDLTSDASQSMPRLTLEEKASSTKETIRVGTVPSCVQKILQAPLCLDDSFTPLVLRADFSVQEEPDVSARNLKPVLLPGTNLSTEIQVPFEQNCGSDDSCMSDLRVSFNFSGSKGLKLSPTFLLNLTLTLENVGETAYDPVLSFYFSRILFFQGVSVLQSNQRVSLACRTHGSQENSSVNHNSCSFKPSALKEGTKLSLQLSFLSSRGDSQGDKFVSFTIQAHSQNENKTLHDNEDTKWLPVLHPVTVVVQGLESTKYLNFSTKAPVRKILTHIYEVRNVNSISTPVNVTFELPVQTELGLMWNVTQLPDGAGKNQPLCRRPSSFKMKNKMKDLKEPVSRGCLGASLCIVILCQIANLSQGQSIKFNFSGDFYIAGDAAAKLWSQNFHLRSEAAMTIDETKFFLDQPENFHYSQVYTEVELISPFNPIPFIIGSTVGGILLLALLVAVLFKFGFFKRNRVPKMDETAAAGQAAPGEATGQPAPSDPTSPGQPASQTPTSS